MSYEYLEDVAIADIAFQAQGKDLSEVFRAAGDATVNAMIDNLEAIEPKETRTFSLENDALDMLLFNFLQEFIYYKDSEQLLLRAQDIKIEKKDDNYYLNAVTQGEIIDPNKHEQRVDVKAVTLHRFQLEKREDDWIAMVILDI